MNQAVAKEIAEVWGIFPKSIGPVANRGGKYFPNPIGGIVPKHHETLWSRFYRGIEALPSVGTRPAK